MNILITGGAGFIGSNIVESGLSRGYNITVLDNLSTGFISNLKADHLNFVKGDICDRDLVFKLIEGKDAIFHLAANVGNIKSIEDPLLDNQVNVQGTINILDAMKVHQVPKIIYSSTAAGYGEPAYLPIDEEHPLHPDSPYGVSKISAEKLILCFAKLYGFSACCLRYFNAYGVNQRFDAYGNVIPIFLTRILRNETLTVYGDGEQTRDFVNVKDLAAINWRVFDQNISGYFNIATGQATSLNLLLKTLREVTGKNFEVEYLPPRKGEVKHSVANIDKAINQLGYKPIITLDKGLESYWTWFQKENLIRT